MRIKGKSDSGSNRDYENISILVDHPTKIFANRITYAFPDIRESITWYNNPKVAAYRLEKLLQQPLRFQRIENGTPFFTTPIWWYRGGRNMYISEFKIMTGSTCLIDDHDELNISKIAVYISNNIFHNFIYVETSPLKKTGLYDKKYESRQLASDGYCVEHYAILGRRFIPIDDFNNGSTIINNKVVPTFNGNGRSRYVSKFNFIIATQRSTYNTRFFDINSEELFNGLISGETDYNEFMNFMKTCRDNYDPHSKGPDPWDSFID